MAVSFIGGVKPEYLVKTTDLPQITDKPHKVVSNTPGMSCIKTHNFSGDRNYHTMLEIIIITKTALVVCVDYVVVRNSRYLMRNFIYTFCIH
jgi:hypothetical protein